MTDFEKRWKAQKALIQLTEAVSKIKTLVETAPSISDSQLMEIQTLASSAKDFQPSQEVTLPNPGAPTLTEWRGKQLGNMLKFRTQKEVDDMPLAGAGTPDLYNGKSIG